MKARIEEYDGCYEINLTAETLAEAVQLVAIGADTTRQLRSCDAYAQKEDGGKFTLSTVIGKSAKASTQVPHLHR